IAVNDVGRKAHRCEVVCYRNRAPLKLARRFAQNRAVDNRRVSLLDQPTGKIALVRLNAAGVRERMASDEDAHRGALAEGFAGFNQFDRFLAGLRPSFNDRASARPSRRRTAHWPVPEESPSWNSAGRGSTGRRLSAGRKPY